MPTRNTAICLAVLLLFTIFAGRILALSPGQTVAWKLIDVDGRTLSATDGPITTLVLTTRADVDKARLVGDRTPDRCLGSPKFRMITVVQFDKTSSRTMRFLYTAMVRRKVNAEAKRLKQRYLTKNLTADPRPDVHVVVDFDGKTASQLGLPTSNSFRVLILGSDGALIREWTDAPSPQDLDSALR